MNANENLRQKLHSVQEQIAAAARSAGRNSDKIKLVVVTKKHPIETLRALVGLGVRHLGESYAEEGVVKKEALQPSLDKKQASVQWHMVGHLQSRKASIVAQHFDLLHSLDSLKLARRLNRFAEEQDKILPVLLEVNVSGEASKQGFPADKMDSWPDLFPVVEQVLQMAYLKVLGLMSMAPIVSKPEDARPYFEHTRRLRDLLAEQFAETNWAQLSMGMSADFEAAILEGATIVRVGTKILGRRPTS